VAVTLSALGASPAWAAAPVNDTIAGATAVSVGFSQVLDTSEATTDAQDAQLNYWCDAPATDASVWYKLEGTNTGVVVDVSQSGYSGGLLVAVVSPYGDLEPVSCGAGTTAFSAYDNTTYYVLAIDDQSDGGGNGGLLNISFNESAAPTVDVAVDPRGTVSKSGVAHISGTYTCTDADFIDAFGDVTQSVGRLFTIRGSFEFIDEGTCDGEPHTWGVDVVPESGKFAGGKAATIAFSFSCGWFDCGADSTEQVVQLRASHG
jgi:hypothetical protein